MPRGDKSSYTDKQKRKAAHIEKGYEKRGVSKKESKARAWATVNKESHGGKKSGSGRGKKTRHVSSRKGGPHRRTREEKEMTSATLGMKTASSRDCLKEACRRKIKLPLRRRIFVVSINHSK